MNKKTNFYKGLLIGIAIAISFKLLQLGKI